VFNVNKNPKDVAVCRYLFAAKLLYMFWVSQHPSSGVLKTVPADSGTGHITCTATPLQRGLIRKVFLCLSKTMVFEHIPTMVKIPRSLPWVLHGHEW